MENAVFIFGLPRSGTTWLGKIFDSHPDTLFRHEPDVISPTADFPYIMPSTEIERYLAPARRYLPARAFDNQLRCVSNQPQFPKRYRSRASESLHRAMIYLAGVANAASRNKLERSLTIPDLIGRNAGVIPVVKSVDSVGRVPLFARACTGNRFVFVIRHPCGVASSVLRGQASGKLFKAKAYRDLLRIDGAVERGFTEQDLRDWTAAELQAWRWTLLNEFVIRNTENLPNVRILNYDRLCENPVEDSKALLAWAGLDWSAQCERYIESCLSVDPAARQGYYSTMKNPAQASKSWMSELEPAVIETIIGICKGSRPGALFFSSD